MPPPALETELGEETVLVEDEVDEIVVTSPAHAVAVNDAATQSEEAALADEIFADKTVDEGDESAENKEEPVSEEPTKEEVVEEQDSPETDNTTTDAAPDATKEEAVVETANVEETKAEPALLDETPVTAEPTVADVALEEEESPVEETPATQPSPAVEAKPAPLLLDVLDEAPDVMLSVTDVLSPRATTEAHVETPNERDFDTNPTPLFAHLQQKEWQEAIARAHEEPEEAKIWVSRKERDGCLRWRLLPLHAAIVFKAPENVMEALLGAFPDGAQAKDDQGMLPLHLAFRNGTSEDVVNLLLIASPQSMDVKDRKGRSPLVLAQASASPYKEAYLRALERGPAYYAGTSESPTELAAIIAEQRAIFEAKLAQAKQSHEHELACMKLAYENKQVALDTLSSEKEQELSKSQEAAEVLADHVKALEAELNTRTDTERFLATKIATLDTDLKNTDKTREQTEHTLKLQNYELISERDTLKAKVAALEVRLSKTTSDLSKANTQSQEKVTEWEKEEEKLKSEAKQAQVDWANAQANCAILDAQLKKKMENEHVLASQVSELASKLAEAACDTRDSNHKYSTRIKELEQERGILRENVTDLTKRLSVTARALNTMTKEHKKILDQAKAQEQGITLALETHAKIVADAMEQQHMLEDARREREEMKILLAKQEEQYAATEAKRLGIMTSIVSQGQHMEKAKAVRADMLGGVKFMNEECKVALESVYGVLPELKEPEGTVGPASVSVPEEEKKEDDAEVTDQSVATTQSDKKLEVQTIAATAATDVSVAEPERSMQKRIDISDRIMAARAD